MTMTKLPVVEGDRPSNEATDTDREGAIRAAVLAP
jgi:hypothetical protein